ncbi:hypothetical protein Rcae01_06621 [Novipirellula caenicola]|uniref:DUF7919 domain-containing protein n=1 Tax=Novipirellula caenicola TaxID=1536901 RepID=A0ABP9W181_9BACT
MVFGNANECELCRFDLPHCHANLFVPDGSVIFVCPGLIVHFIAAHHYRPPNDFGAVVAAYRDTRTMLYRKSLLSSGGRTLVPKRSLCSRRTLNTLQTQHGKAMHLRREAGFFPNGQFFVVAE